jgi:hypothetical protein
MTILPLSPFPNGYWLSFYLSADEVVLDAHENYIKQSWRNRYDILSANGSMALTIPVVGQNGQKVAVRDIRIAPGAWKKQHWQSIKSAYGSAPYFIHYADEIEEFFATDFKWLRDFNLTSLKLVHQWLEIEQPLPMSEEYVDNATARDVRKEFKPTQTNFITPPYPQVFEAKMEFVSNLSVIDLIMNEGPMAMAYLRQLAKP